VSLEYLWRYVPRGPALCLEALHALALLGETKVRDFDVIVVLLRMEEEVLGLQVAMGDLAVVNVAKGRQDGTDAFPEISGEEQSDEWGGLALSNRISIRQLATLTALARLPSVELVVEVLGHNPIEEFPPRHILQHEVVVLILVVVLVELDDAAVVHVLEDIDLVEESLAVLLS